MTLVDLTGFRLTSGRQARGCQHMAEWLPVYNRYLIHLGVIKRNVDIEQAAGGSPKSGNTHIEGTCLDLIGSQCSTVAVNAAREGGAPATWGRGPWVRKLGARDAAIRGFGDHIHLHILCPCRSGADYQTSEVKQGQDGLIGWGGDYHPRPTAWRNWREGMAWMEAQMAKAPKPVPKPSDVAVTAAASSPKIKAAPWGSTLSLATINNSSDPRQCFAYGLMLWRWSRANPIVPDMAGSANNGTVTAGMRRTCAELQKRMTRDPKPTRTDGVLDFNTLAYLCRNYGTDQKWKAGL